MRVTCSVMAALGRWNEIGDVGAEALGKALTCTKSLTLLNLQRNKIGNVGAQALAQALEVLTPAHS